MRTASLFLLLISAVTVIAQSDIRSVDFKNFTYEPLCAGEESEKVTVKDGEFSFEKQMDGYVDRFYFNIFDTAFGDLDGDGKEEAVILSVCNTGGTGNFSEGYVYKIRSGKPLRVARIMGGDRAYGGLRSARIIGRFIVIERNDVGEMGGACCPEFVLTEKYRLSGDKVVEIGKATRRDMIPTERVLFAKGTSGKTFTTNIAGGEAKRFIVGARAGQRLSVSINTDRASLRLLGEARVTEGINSFVAVLPRNGDYTFEVQNNADNNLKIAINVKIY
ncbi:MAG: hypothetical protein ACT4O9_17470 [Blastocatellia bacterium]